MKHWANSFFKLQGQKRFPAAIMNGFSTMGRARSGPERGAVSYPLKPDFIRSFAMSGLPFLTFYEFNDLSGWCRDTYFAPDHVEGYAQDAGQTYTVWTHEAVSAYRRHIILDDLQETLSIAFEVPFLTASAWFPLRISLYDTAGMYFQTDQKLVVERLDAQGAALSSWKKIPRLRDSLLRLHARGTA